MHYFHIIEAIERIIGIFLSIVTILGVFVGVYMASNYISKIKERQYAAIFNFYSRFHMYLLEFKNKLGTPDQSVLLLRYDKSCLEKAVLITIPDNDEIKAFKKFLGKFICFLEDTDNQIPLSKIILVNKYKLKNTLILLTTLNKKTPYSEFNNNEPVIKEHDEILSVINVLLKNIEEKQIIIANKIDENIK